MILPALRMAQLPQDAKGFPDTASANMVTAVSIGDGDLHPTKLVHQKAYFGLEKIGFARHPNLQHFFHCLAIKTLEPAGHIAHFSLDQNSGKQGAALADKNTGPGTVVTPITHEPASADIVKTLLHPSYKAGNFLG